jgi:negative regulator of flagellin synthesis FlgM
MKISDVKDTTAHMVSQYQRNENARQDIDKAASGVPLPQEEKVDLSTKAREIEQITVQLADTPDIREDKVRALRAQIEQGTYRVGGEKIAEKMVGESLVDIFA